MVQQITDFSVNNPPKTWAERVNSYPPQAHFLGDAVKAFDELQQEGKARGKRPMRKTGLPHFTAEELDALVENMQAGESEAATKNACLKQAWKSARERKSGDLWDYHQKTYNTGSQDVVAFKNIRPSPPVSVLVCPTKPYNTFSHFIKEASPEEIGEFFKSVLRAARHATDEHDREVTKDPERLAKRTHYENEFDRIRNERQAGTLSADDPQIAKTFEQYMNDSRQYKFAVRDPRTGRSGFRIAINDSAAVSGNSQAHFHVQILGGMFLGAPSNDLPLTPQETQATAKVITR